MTGSHRVVLLACGSFNPPTNMHLRMFEIARDFLHRTTNYHVVAGLMSPVHDKYGKEGLVSATDRVQMLRLALNSSAWVHVSEWETHQDEWTPTREVLQYHQELIDSMVNGNVDPTVKRQRVDGSTAWLTHLSGSTDTVTIKLLCGADLLESFAKPGLWKDEDIEALVGKFGLVVITREGSNPYKFIYESDVLTRHQRNIHIVTEWIANEISSTKVRRALRRGDSVKYLVQDAVIDYIYKNALFDTHNNKYFYSPFMLTPSPNLDTDVLLPPPNFTLGQGQGRSRGLLLASRHHPIRKSSLFSDLDDTSPGDSVDDVPAHHAPALAPTHAPTVKSYPGVAMPVAQRQHKEVGQEAKERSRIKAAETEPFSKTRLAPSKFFGECSTVPPRDKKGASEVPFMNSSHSLDELELTSSLTVDYLHDKLASAPQSRGASPSAPKPLLAKSLSVSPRETTAAGKAAAAAAAEGPTPRKVFTSHSRSKSSGALKPEKAFELAQSARDDISLIQRDTGLLSLGTSNMYELLSKKTHVSPSHTEMCLTYMPKKAEPQPPPQQQQQPVAWERSRGHRHGEHLFTSRSLERPSTPKHNKHLSSIHKVSSLPLQQTRDRSPSPVRTQTQWRLERQYAQFTRDNTCDVKDVEVGGMGVGVGVGGGGLGGGLSVGGGGVGGLRRTLTHEEEINLIISGDSKFLTKLKSPETYAPPELPASDGLLLPQKEYEMKF
ncbi:uncharacterized protein LOC126984598 isoform X2 [Eriocheir sinensis]|uniref:uncharacterized protein LOC126984598 isoform X2 n=1 Tax=Eriocheir sinensis TaxID=95602 RepID=UPI0021C968B3|nr:uncharacterized protein LOC126984598 isoform X2 [Eriocheir sinensis]